MQGIPHIASTPHDGRWSSVPPARREQQHTGQYTARDMTQRIPPPVAAPRVTPAARRPRAAAPQLPVFIDQSGWRRRTLQGVALAVGCACLGYLLFVGTLVSGLRQPVGTQPPSTNGPAPSGPDTGTDTRPDTGTSQHGRGVPDQAGAHRPPAGVHADRDHHRRPSTGGTGRSAPAAGGPKQ